MGWGSKLLVRGKSQPIWSTESEFANTTIMEFSHKKYQGKLARYVMWNLIDKSSNT